MGHERDRARLLDLLHRDPALASDLLRWAESSRTVGVNGVFAGFRGVDSRTRDAFEPAAGRPMVLRRRCGLPAGNRFYHADNLPVLMTLLNEGVFARCVYIDPPYGTQQRFARKATGHAAYCDGASGAGYLGALRARLGLLRDLLDEEGSLFVHLDTAMVAEVKLLLDELFGNANFRGWITRRKCSSKNYTRKSFGDISDYILFYSKTAKYVFNRQFEKRSPEQEAIDFPKLDPASGRRFALVPIHAPGTRNGATGEEWRGLHPPKGKHWQWKPEKLDEFDAKGDIYWTRNGTPRRKIWAEDSAGSSVTNMWHDFRDPFNQNFAITGYPTEKNLDLLRRVISAASNPGDLILDCYAGSATTLDAAGSLGRRWIGVDSSSLAVALAQRRLSEKALSESQTARASLGFELWSDATAGAAPSLSAHEAEFALVERVEPGEMPEIVEVLKPTQILERVERLVRKERLVAFDHGGNERLYTASDSIHSIEKRPA